MKPLKRKIRHYLVLLSMFIGFFDALAQTAPEDAIVYTIANDVQVNARQLEFDLMLWDSVPSEPFQVSTVQAGIFVNPEIYNGGVLTSSIVPGSSTMVPLQQPTSTVFTQSANIIKLAGKLPPGCGNGTIVSQDPLNRTRLCRLRLTNTVDFTGNSKANLTLSFMNLPYAVKLFYYEAESCSSVASPLIASNAYSMAANLSLNTTPTCPFPFPVVGSGTYCTGGIGLPVGLSGSESGVTYTLYKDGVLTSPSVTGTGAAISFGNQLAGYYTVIGVNTVCPDGVPMAGNATILEHDIVAPVFTPIGPLCQGATPPALPAVSTNGVSGYWTPPVINTGTPGTSRYRFTPGYNQCATADSMDITIVPTITPVFAPFGSYCVGDPPWVLPATSQNGISGTWFPPSVNTSVSGVATYTFTPSPGLCAVAITQTIYVSPPTAALFAALGPFCQFSAPPPLPAVSLNGISGNWNPTEIQTAVLGVSSYIFTPDAGQCALADTLSIEIATQIIPSFAPVGPLCLNATAPPLPSTSLNGISGTWDPPVITTSSIGSTIYAFTPVNAQCAVPTTLTIEVNTGPENPGSITGPSSVTQVTFGVVYSIEPVANATGYAWNYTGTGVQIDGIGTSVTLGFALGATSGELSVYGYNSCGNGAAATLSITVNPICQSTVWTGVVNTDWFTVGNWNPCLPSDFATITIPSGCPNYPIITGAKDPCLWFVSLTIEDGAELIGQQYLCNNYYVTVKRVIPNSDFHYLSSPLTFANWGVFPAGDLNDIFSRRYDEPSGNWVNLAASDNLIPGAGYSLHMNSYPHTASFSGHLNKETISCPLSHANPSTEVNRVGWNLLGNPFTSAIDWDLIPPGAFDAQVAVYDESYGGYKYWNHVIGNLEEGIIPAQNGFFVRASNPGGGTLSIPLSAQVFTNHAFYKSSVSNVLEIKAQANGYSDAAFIHLNESATSEFDNQFDAFKFWGLANAPQVYTMASGYKLSINELPYNPDSPVVLAFECGSSGTYTLNFSGIENFESTLPIWLEDTKTGTKQNLRTNPIYILDYSTVDVANRFKLHFSSTFAIPDLGIKGLEVFSYQNVVIIKNPGKCEGTISITDFMGRQLAQDKLSRKEEIRVPMQVSVGSYLVKVTSSDGNVCVKVFLH